MAADASAIRRAGRRLRSSVGSRLPEGVGYTLWQRAVPRLGLGRALGHRVPEAIDASLAARIDTWPQEALSDPAALEPLVADLGINAEFARVLPADLRRYAGTGLRASQYPNQLAPYLALLGTLGISSYLEVGVDHGGTFLITTGYLRRVGALERAVAVDRFEVPALSSGPGAGAATEALRMDSTSRAFARYLAGAARFDLALIDGDHSERGCRRDFEAVAPHARVIALHDIVGANTPGVRAVWAWVRETRAAEYDFHEFTSQYPEVEAATGERYMGLGVAVRRRS